MLDPYRSFRWQTRERFDEAPYNYHPYAYALSNPVLYVDPTGKFAENWTSVEFYKGSFKDIAAWHVQNARRDLHGVTTEVLATIMAATVAIENNWGEVLGRRALGDALHFFDGNPSTGIANFKVTTAMELINDCEVPLRFAKLIRTSGWGIQLPYSPTNRIHRQEVYNKLQTDVFSIDLLAAHLVESIYKTADAGLVPSVFNIANYRWFGGPQTAKELFAGTNPSRHGEHGVRVIRNFDKAAEVLGLNVKLAALPNALQPYYKDIHPADATAIPPFKQTEQNWADLYAQAVD